MTIFKNHLFFIFFLGHTISVIGAVDSKSIDPEYPIHGMIMDQWSNEDGLLSNNLTSITQSKNGFLWTTSHNGLQRFDGRNFKSFTKLNVPFLNSNSFYDVFESSSDTIWFTTEGSGILCMSKGVIFPYNGNDSIPKAIITMHFAGEDEIWIGTKNKGVYLGNRKGEISKISNIPEVTINYIKEDSKGNIWVATDGNGLYQITSEKIKHFNRENGLISNVINHIEINNDLIYLSTINGMNVMKGDELSTVEKFEGLDINQTKIDTFGTIWVASEKGLAKWNKKQQIFELFTEAKGLPGRQVSGLTFDTEGSLWLSTKKAGLVRFRQGKITTISSKNGLSSNKINIVGKNNNAIFIGTDNGEINFLKDGKFSELICDKEFQDAGIRDFLFDTKGRTWVVNYNGLLKQEGSKKTIYGLDNGLPSSQVRRIFQDSKERIWIGTKTGGIINFRENLDHITYNKSNGLESNYIVSIEEDLKNNIVIGTNAGGLSLIDPQGNVVTKHLKEDDSGILIFNTHIDESNSYFLCTNIGLFHYSKGVFTHIFLNNGTESKAFFDLVDDQKGGYWLTSNFGILRIEKSGIEDYLNGDRSSVSYELFDDHEGMLNNECTGATRSFFDNQTGKVYVPTFNGVSIIDPSINLFNKVIPPNYMTSLEIDDDPVNLESHQINVDPGAFRYTFDFASLSYLSPSRVQFKYRLEGIDEEWIGPVSNASVEYTNLPYGDYTFNVKGSNNDGLWNEEGASVTFTVLPFFYETAWFYIVSAFLLLLILGIIYNWRVRDITKRNLALAKINSELDRFVYSASHDLRAPLASTLGLVNIAQMESSPELKDTYINLIEECVRKMDQFISDIIDFSRNKNKEIEPKNFDIHELISEIVDNLKYLEQADHVETKINILGDAQVGSDRLRIKMILSNLIANAIIYSKKGNSKSFVNIQVQAGKSLIKINVEDNGIGIPAKEKSKVFNMFYRANEQSKGSGLGLYIVNETVGKLGGTIMLNSEEGHGTTFDISLPNMVV